MHVSSHPRPRRARRTPAAFTLIELLTVIAIIGILAAILVPVVGSVRAKARAAQCASNLRQLGLGFALFSQERGYFPGSGNIGRSGVDTWHTILEPYIPVRGVGSGTVIESIFLCPVARQNGQYFYVGTIWDGPTKLGAFHSSYAYNWQVSGQNLSNLSSAKAGVGLAIGKFDDGLSRTILAIDGATSYQLQATDAHVAERVKFLHSDRANALFADGHVQSLSVSDPVRQFLTPAAGD
jgi:prepilin-type N-terminal cleavage/methylation domain-containing protein/prepilin-type processing-associated H-X9-DG protein